MGKREKGRGRDRKGKERKGRGREEGKGRQLEKRGRGERDGKLHVTKAKNFCILVISSTYPGASPGVPFCLME